MNETLGMPFGTACNRLRKMLLFDAISRLEENQCYVCGNNIESIDEFTIEHKQPWRKISAELFWSLDNISYSHSKCNRPNRAAGQLSKRRRDDGKWLCKECKSYKSIEEFSLYDSGTPRQWCKKCRADRKSAGVLF